ncbi:kinase-like protein [Periconia macrospinosa]|uniref:Kinase-like protein n=1 Tax=Periconia macrospinosa TaxID=97972 RepID=A0A2V1D991_9PLEO|nr:kinase-like protein [Periconia macrospinosa]
MDFAYSPHREGGTMHLPSPTHQGYRMEGAHFSSLQQLRRSLSRSPSKPSRFQLRTTKTDVPGSPLSPLALARAFTPKTHKPASPIANAFESAFTSQTVPAKKKFTLRRAGPFRSSPRNRANPKSPRRALVDSTDLGNSTTPFASRSLFGDENTHTPAPVRKPSVDFWDTADSMRFDIDDKPIKFGITRSQAQSSNAPGANCFTPNQASPLKRRDGNPAFDSGSSMTPNPKRRSLHGAPAGADFSIFETPIRPVAAADDAFGAQDSEPFNLFSTPANSAQTPMKRPLSVRRSTSQRTSANSPRPKPLFDGEFAMPGLAASKSKQRISLDGAALRSSNGSQTRHPLANSLTASSSSPAVGGDSPDQMPPPPTVAPPSRHPFAKSLPIGASRPTQIGADQIFATPAALKNMRQHAAPVPFSTGGLMSKKHRDISLEVDEYKPPGTPIKRQSYPPALAETPTSNRRSHSFKPLQQPVFGTASTPFNSIQTSNQGSNFFSDMANPHIRRRSFVDIDGDSDCNESPTGNKHMTDSQSSADDGPPTPTKPSGDGRRSKESSLRRKTFGRSRPSINNAFVPDEASITIPKASDMSLASNGSPHTPNDSSLPLDASSLSFSGSRRDSLRDSLSFNSSLASTSFPPATPTGPRGSFGFFNQSQVISVTENDVDESLAARFRTVEKLDGAEGEFSQVFKVSRPIKQGASATSSPSNRCWVVKKSKKPLMGSRDSEQKHREVNALRALRGHEHIVSFEDSWVDQNHLYIQTEYCEDGNLRQFLQKYARAGCLDNFRTWKMLLELSSGLTYIHESGFIHLDLKPANILLDFSGNLKIADFGMAAQWPLPEHFDGEGDRHYLALEAMNGNPDKPSDVFALGLMMVEICSNCFMPEMGDDWYRLRSGNFIDVPSLTWSEDSTLVRDSDGLPISQDNSDVFDPSMMDDSDFSFSSSVGLAVGIDEEKEFAKAPDFMKDALSPYSMDQIVRAMLDPTPNQRPTADEVHRSFGCQWVDQRRRAGATIYEGNFGPDYDVLASYGDHPDAMDTS